MLYYIILYYIILYYIILIIVYYIIPNQLWHLHLICCAALVLASDVLRQFWKGEPPGFRGTVGLLQYSPGVPQEIAQMI